VRIEHTKDDQNRPTRGFEARGSHQAAFTSKTTVHILLSFSIFGKRSMAENGKDF
jgi:hypothetical protein